MLKSLHIRHYVLIDSLDIVFPEGLVIVTGQTGAGKSILLGALSLALGGKADPSVISEGADKCIVEAEFGLDESFRELFDANDVEWDGGIAVIRRVVSTGTRSRSFVNDIPVNLQFLGELSARLVDIHSQHQSLLLRDHNWQMAALDRYAGNASLLSGCAACWKRILALRAELRECEDRLSKMNADRGYNAARFEKLTLAKLRDGELEELEQEHRALSHAEEIKLSLCAVDGICNPVDGDGISSKLSQARRALQKVSGFVPGLDTLAERMESARIELDDILAEVENCNSGISLSEERLRELESRMSLIYGLLAEYSCGTVSELITLRDSLAATVEGFEELEEHIARLEGELDSAQREHAAICSTLAGARAGAASGFASEIQSMLRFLELEKAEFSVELTDTQPGAAGSQSVCFKFSSNGTSPEDLSKCASGGEISRIMLCLKSLMSKFSFMPTMIFDEIDTGVSGSVADRMGSMICSMGSDMQVLAITHLPQVAAKGDAHFLVSKSEQNGKTVTSIRRIEGEDRVKEIARLLSGATISAEAEANARVLLAKS